MKNNRCIDDYMMDGNMGAPIYECPCERVENREIHHEVRHIKPVHTRIINHHIYHHTCVPCYTCSEECQVCNVYDDNCKC